MRRARLSFSKKKFTKVQVQTNSERLVQFFIRLIKFNWPESSFKKVTFFIFGGEKSEFFEVHFLVLINMDQGLNRASSCRKMSKKHDAVCGFALSCLVFELDTQSQSLWNNLIFLFWSFSPQPKELLVVKTTAFLAVL